MSFISNFIINHFLSAVESEFVAREPLLQATLVAEVNALVEKATAWVNSKIPEVTPPASAE